jgi:hypothetical protein
MTHPQIERAQWKTRLHSPPPGMCNIYFSEQWPDAYKWCKGKYWEITKTVVVPYEKGYIIPGDDYVDLNLSNATGALKLYPATEGVVYEALIGLGKGNYQIGIYIPGTNDYLLNLGETSQYPNLADPDRRYLGAIIPEDSPAENPLLKLWFIKDMPSYILKVYVRPGVDFEKIRLRLLIAKHKLIEIPKPKVFTTIEYYTELKGW